MAWLSSLFKDLRDEGTVRDGQQAGAPISEERDTALRRISTVSRIGNLVR
jgi:hypothetical protein